MAVCNLSWSAWCVHVCNRPLYDRYGQRVDYGEGEWPSVWPSEIQQDEIKGWSLVNPDAAHGYSLLHDQAAAALAPVAHQYHGHGHDYHHAHPVL